MFHSFGRPVLVRGGGVGSHGGGSAHLVPFYAVDKEGNPVYDLKQEEIRLLVNLKEVPILTLSGFRFDFNEEDPSCSGSADSLKPAFEVPDFQKRLLAGPCVTVMQVNVRPHLKGETFGGEIG